MLRGGGGGWVSGMGMGVRFGLGIRTGVLSSMGVGTVVGKREGWIGKDSQIQR